MLTTGIDSVAGTAGNDTIVGDNATMGSADTINGGAGRDTLKYTDSSTTGVAASPIVSNVEVINIRNVNGSAAVAATKEQVTLTFNDFTHSTGAGDTDGSITVGGTTLNLTADTTGAQIAQAFATIRLPAGYEFVSISGAQLVLRATTAGNVTDITTSQVLGTGGTTNGTMTAPTLAIAQGTNAVASTGIATTFDASTFVGATDFITDLSTNGVTFNNLVAGQSIGANGNGATTVGALTGTYGAAVTSATLNLTGGLQTGAVGGTLQGSGAVTINGAGIATANINSSGAANAVGGVSFVGAAVTTLNIAADAAFGLTAANTITGFSAGQTSTINVTGAGAVRLNTLDAALDVYNAAAATGAQTLTVGSVTQKITTGSANDIITTGGVLTTGSVAAGAGTADRLIVANSADVATAALGAKYSGFEQVQVQNGQAVDLALLAANNTIDTIRLNNAVGTADATNLNATQAANIQITGAAAGQITIGVKDANVGGQIDTVKAALTTTTAAGAAQNIDLATAPINLSGVEKLELTGNGTAAATTGTVSLNTGAAISLDSIKLSNAGNANVITINALHAATNLVVDASGSTGNTTINASAYNTLTGATLKGGSGNDILLGSARVDNLTGGNGRDIFDANDGNSTAAATDKIADFGKITAAVADVSGLNMGNFQGATEVRGGANADLIDVSATAATRATVVATATDVAAASGNAALDIKATVDARGLVTLSGADLAQIDTKAEAIAVFNLLNSVAGGTGVVNLNGNAYIIQEDGANNFVHELTGVTLTGVSIIGAAGTGLVGEAFVV